MANLDWSTIEAEANTNKNFLDYAPNGEHTVKVDEVTKRDNGKGWFEFTFVDGEYKYPKLSFAFFGDDKVNFRAHYYKEVMKQLGASEEAARKAVEVCEGKSGRENIFKAYADAFNRLAKKHPELTIEVRDQFDRDGNPVRSANGTTYSESVFSRKSGLQFPSNGVKKTETKAEDILEEGKEAEEIEISDLPF